MGLELLPAGSSPASVSDYGATNKKFYKNKHLQIGFARSNFSTVISPTIFSFALRFNILVL